MQIILWRSHMANLTGTSSTIGRLQEKASTAFVAHPNGIPSIRHTIGLALDIGSDDVAGPHCAALLRGLELPAASGARALPTTTTDRENCRLERKLTAVGELITGTFV
jgi:hypothetical protein